MGTMATNLQTGENRGTERNERGQFLKGVSGNPKGRPASATAYLNAVRRLVDETSFARIVEQAIADAQAGDGEARRWLADRLLGKLTVQDLDERERPGGDELDDRIAEELASFHGDELRRLLKHLSGGKPGSKPDVAALAAGLSDPVVNLVAALCRELVKTGRMRVPASKRKPVKRTRKGKR
jgi:hypothetical protein